MKYARLLIPVLALAIAAPITAEEDDKGCCHLVARGLSVAGVAIAMGGAAGDKPLAVLPGDPSRIDADLAVCREDIVNALIGDKKLYAKDCGDKFGLFGIDAKLAKDPCEGIGEPATELPPGRLEGWQTTAVFTDRHGERLAVLGAEDGRAYMVGPGMALASAGAKVEGIGGQALLVARGGVDALNTSLAPTFASAMAGGPELSCQVQAEAEGEDGAEGRPTETDAGTGDTGSELPVPPPSTESGAETEADGHPTETDGGVTPIEEEAEERDEGPLYRCEGFEPDFIQRPLPVEICDDPAHAGTALTAEVEFGYDGWPRKLISVDADEAIADALGAAIRDWRIVPPELDGAPIRVQVTVPFTLEIPCR